MQIFQFWLKNNNAIHRNIYMEKQRNSCNNNAGINLFLYFCSYNLICVHFIVHSPHDRFMACLLSFLLHRSLISLQVPGLLGDPSRLLLQKVLGLRTPAPVPLGKGLLGDSPTGESFWLSGQARKPQAWSRGLVRYCREGHLQCKSSNCLKAPL